MSGKLTESVDHWGIPSTSNSEQSLEEAVQYQEISLGSDDNESSYSAEGYISSDKSQLSNWLSKYGLSIEDIPGVDSFGILKNIWVDEELRGQGLGSEMMHEFISRAEEVDAIFLIADSQQTQADGFDLVRFYKSFGFKKIKETSAGPLMILELEQSLEESVRPSVLYHWTSKVAAEEIQRTKVLKPSKPNDRDVSGVYLTDLDNAEDVRRVLGTDISTEARIVVPMQQLDLSRAAKPQLYNGDIMSGEKYARNSLKSVHELVYLDEIDLDGLRESLIEANDAEKAEALKKEYLSLRAYLFDRSKKNPVVRKAKSEKMDRIISELISLGVTEIEVPGSVGYDGKPVTVKLEEGARGEWEKEGGYTFSHVNADDSTTTPVSGDQFGVFVHRGDELVGSAYFTHHGNYLQACDDDGNSSVVIDPDYKRKGLASALYVYAENLTKKKILPSEGRTDAGKAFWSQPNRPFGESVDSWGLPSVLTEEIVDGADQPLHGVITPSGRFIDMNELELHDATIAIDMGIDPVDFGEEQRLKAAALGYIWVGIAGFNEVAADAEIIRNKSHPATRKLRALVGKHWDDFVLNGEQEYDARIFSRYGTLKIIESTSDQVKSLVESEDLKPVSELKRLAPELAKAAQAVYDDWGMDEFGNVWCRHQEGPGGICHLIADEMISVISKHGFDCTELSHDSMVHVSVLVKTAEGVAEVDINPYRYETGGGYSWKKIPDVQFDPEDVFIHIINRDPEVFDQHLPV